MSLSICLIDFLLEFLAVFFLYSEDFLIIQVFKLWLRIMRIWNCLFMCFLLSLNIIYTQKTEPCVTEITIVLLF